MTACLYRARSPPQLIFETDPQRAWRASPGMKMLAGSPPQSIFGSAKSALTAPCHGFRPRHVERPNRHEPVAAAQRHLLALHEAGEIGLARLTLHRLDERRADDQGDVLDAGQRLEARRNVDGVADHRELEP